MGDKIASEYTGKALRVNLTQKTLTVEPIRKSVLRDYIGGAGLGAYYLYKEVPPQTDWSDSGNRLIFSVGPLNGIPIPGAGCFCITTVGALTNGATSTQANGFFGYYLKSCGFDAVIVQGKADGLVYLYIHDGAAELRDGRYLNHKDTYETPTLIKQELGKSLRELSVFGIGPAGENLVRFACVLGDDTHVAAHNGVGAVMGAMRLKAIAAERSYHRAIRGDDPEIKRIINELREEGKKGTVYSWGTSMQFPKLYQVGEVPVKNYTTNVFLEAEAFEGRNYRARFKLKRNSCFACSAKHCHKVVVSEGPYAGYMGEEPEYEQWASWGPLIDQKDVGGAVVLSNDIDRLGMDTNEGGWVVAWLMECLDKGLIAPDALGIKLNWGDVEATREILRKIAFREGIGDLLAEGIMRASKKIGGETADRAVYTLKGNTPRSHDHRARWWEMFDTCVSNTGTIETLHRFPREQIGLPAAYDPFSPEQVSSLVAQTKGSMQFEDSLTVCRLITASNFGLLCQLLNAVTGWDYTVDTAMETGKRIVNLLKVFNLRRGIGAEHDRPSCRYASTPVDGPAQGKSVMPVWDDMLRNYYANMGWDKETGKPLPDTLRKLGLEHIVADIWK